MVVDDLGADDRFAALDPALERLLAGAPPPGRMRQRSISELRHGFAAMTREAPGQNAGLSVEDLTLPGAAGHLSARRYTPAQPRGDALVLFLHGGGFIMGDLETHEGLCRRLALASGLTWLACTYRRAPEHRYPAARQDVAAVVAHVRSRQAAGRPLILAGDSAGAHLAIWAALDLIQHGTASADGLVLLYPLVSFDRAGGSREQFADGPFLAQDDLAFLREQYLGSQPEPPLLTPDLSVLPPTLVATAGHDPLCDDGNALALAIAAAGVPVRRFHFPSLIHAFGNFAHLVPTAADAVSRVGEAIGRVEQA